MCQRGRGGLIVAGSVGSYVGAPRMADYAASKAFSRIFTEALWGEWAPLGVDVLYLGIGLTGTPALARLGGDINVAEKPEKVAQEAFDNIANGPLWIVSTKGNVERARQHATVDGRAEIVRAFADAQRRQIEKKAR